MLLQQQSGATSVQLPQVRTRPLPPASPPASSFPTSQRSLLQPQRQPPPPPPPQTQASVSAPLYNTMMISQPGQPNVLQISTTLPQSNAQPGTAVAAFTQDRQIR